MKTKHIRHILVALLAVVMAMGTVLPVSAAAPKDAKLDWAVAGSAINTDYAEYLSVVPTGGGDYLTYSLLRGWASAVKRYGSDGRQLSIDDKSKGGGVWDDRRCPIASSTDGNYFRIFDSGFVKYAASGKKLWTATMGEYDRTLALSAAPDGGCYAAGANWYWVESDDMWYKRIFVAGYGSDGELMWRHNVMLGQPRDGSEVIYNWIYGMATLPDGGVALLDKVNFYDPSNNLDEAFYLEVFDANGNHTVNKKIRTNKGSSKKAHDGAWLDAGGVTYLYSQWSKGNKRTPRMIRYDLSGKKRYDKVLPYFTCNSIAPTPGGGFVAVGAMSKEDAKRSWKSLKVRGKSDAVIFKYDRSGKLKWKKRFGGSGTDSFWYATVDQDGKIVVAGESDKKSVGTYDLKKVKGIKKAHREKGVNILARFTPPDAKPAAKG